MQNGLGRIPEVRLFLRIAQHDLLGIDPHQCPSDVAWLVSSSLTPHRMRDYLLR